MIFGESVRRKSLKSNLQAGACLHRRLACGLLIMDRKHGQQIREQIIIV
jgi:hypothetical protein